MPRQLVINDWCDPCYKDGETTEAVAVTMALGDLKNGRPQVLLMCEAHKKDYYDRVRELLEEFGQAPEAARKTPSTSLPKEEGESGLTFTCPLDGQAFPSRQSIGRHGRREHDLTITTLLGEPVEFICKNCPSEPAQEYGTGTGFAAHRRVQHDLTPEDPLLPGENLVDDREFLKIPKANSKKRGAVAA